jgi:hypothetical protein
VSGPVTAVLVLAASVAIGGWLSVLGVRVAQLQVLPANCRRRVRWWQAHTTVIAFVCAIAAIAAVSLQISTAVGQRMSD